MSLFVFAATLISGADHLGRPSTATSEQFHHNAQQQTQQTLIPTEDEVELVEAQQVDVSEEVNEVNEVEESV